MEIGPQWIVDDDYPAVGEGFDRMADTRRHNRDQPRTGDLSHAVDGHLKLALDHFVDFFLKMEMLVNGRATHEIVNARMSCSASGNSVHTNRANAL